MATWEERDPRWHVKELGSRGSNVGGWHWEETNRLSWTRERLAELCTGLEAKLDSSLGQASITGLKEVTGEAVLTKRKGNKKFAHYDLVVQLQWEGKWTEPGPSIDSKAVTGTVKITEFSSSSDPDEYLIEVLCEGSGEAQDNLKATMQGLRPELLQRLEQYVRELSAS